MKVVIACVTVMLVVAVPISVQERDTGFSLVLPECVRTGSTAAELAAYADCLEERTNQLLDLVNALDRMFKTLANDYDEMNTRLERAIGVMNGPEKFVAQIPANAYAIVRAFWEGGQRYETRGSDPEERDGFVKYGATLTGWQNTPPFGPSQVGWTVGTDFCNSAGEFCRYRSLSQGCYVNEDWYEWYLDRAERYNLPINLATVCADPSS